MTKAPPKLVGLGIIGKNNAPLYMCDCTALLGHENNKEDDFYGFLQTSSSHPSHSLAVQHQLLLHAALDQILVVVDHTKSRSDAVLLLLDLGEWQVHGYKTATNLKLMALTQKSTTNNNNNKGDDADAVRKLLDTVHELYIAYAMNPFHPIRNLESIESKTFDANLQRAVRRYAGLETVE